MKAWANTAAVAAVFVGAVIGAGFASGRELWQFFAAYGRPGLAGALLSGVWFALTGGAAVLAARRSPGGSASKSGAASPWLGLGSDGDGAYSAVVAVLPGMARRFIETMTWAFLFVGLGVVLAGAGALATEEWGLPYDLGVLGLGAPVATVLLARERGFVLANIVLSPLLLALIAALSARALILGPVHGAPAPGPGALSVPWWWAATLYAAYNMMVGSVAIASLDAHRLNRPGAVRGAVLGGIALGLFAVVGVEALLRFGPAVGGYDVPLAAVARAQGTMWRVAFSAALYAALFTTALADAFGLAARFGRGNATIRRWLPLVALALAVPLTRVGLGELVRVVYPIAGYSSLALMVALPWAAVRGWLNREAT